MTLGKNLKKKQIQQKQSHQKIGFVNKGKPAKRRSEGISPQGMQLPIVTNPYPRPQGIGRGGAGSLQEDAGI